MSNITSFQQRLEQSRAAKGGQRAAEQQHWDTLVARVDEPVVARMIVSFFDHAPTEKLKQPGLYLRAKLVLSDSFASEATRAKQANRAVVRTVSEYLGAAGYFFYRCVRLPFRAVRDLAAIARRRRPVNRPLFHH
ncbi:hypothetical protein EZJ19_07800 [Parasulfuritortus cantonensis]|uniref:Uncharacterized protein n=1 Tax=Parasulfuritortus cantonensis TaxID=2528202 RepID=A0A4R1BDR1_9PROT|nr:hypothetical protein [Parasulfuritortus cantonensis]TCJ15203.1 hypothetical protein EZJ19_07800 [Parasulfuritortus cantonensis]